MTMRSRIVVALLGALFALAAIASSAFAQGPRLERVALSRADMHRASAALLRLVDLAGVPPGWRPLTTAPDNFGPICPWQDYSRFTLTGRGESDFQPTKVGGAGFVGSRIEILASESDALGKFAVDTHAGTLACESKALRNGLGTGLTTVSARQTAPAVGEHAVAYEFVYSLQHGTPKRIYVNVIEFVRGRGVAVLDTTNFDTPGSEQTRLALVRDLDGRLR
jgi:hypothetical protein